MFFGTKLIKYQVSFGDPLNLWGFYSLTAPHYGKGSTGFFFAHMGAEGETNLDLCVSAFVCVCYFIDLIALKCSFI